MWRPKCGADTAEDCMTDHIALRLHATRRGMSPTWKAPCPVCSRGDTPLDITIGQKWMVWHCNAGRDDGLMCDGATVKKAMRDLGVSPACITWSGESLSGRSTDRNSDSDAAERLAQIEEIIRSDAANPQRIRLLVGMVLWDCNRAEAAAELGISRATAYRVVSPVRQNPKSQNVSPVRLPTEKVSRVRQAKSA